MAGTDKTKEQLLQELAEAQQRIVELEMREAGRIQTEASLRESEERYRGLFDGVPTGLYRTTPDGTIIDANSAFVAMLGYPDRASFLAVNAIDIYVDPLERDHVSALLERDGIVPPYQIQLRRFDGSTIWVEDTVRAVYDDARNVVYYEGAIADITERKRVEAGIAHFFEQPLVMLFIADLENNLLLRVNSEVMRITGRTEEELLSRPWIDFIHPDDREASLEAEALTAGGESLARFRNRHVTADGDLRVFEWTATADTERKLLYAMARDVTEQIAAEKALRESEEKYRGLVEGLNEVIFRVTIPEAVYEYISPSCQQVFGYSADTFMSTPRIMGRIIHPDFLDYFRQKWFEMLNGVVLPTYEYKILDPEGNEQWIYQSNRAILDDQGKLVAMEGLCRNVTEQKRAEAALRESEERYRTLFENAPIGIGLSVPGGQVQMLNNFAQQMSGFTTEELSQLEVHESYRNPEDRLRFMELLEQDGFVKDYEIEMRRKDGSFYDASLTMIPFPLGGEDLTLTMVVDVSEQKQAEAALQQRLADLAALYKVSQELIDQVAVDHVLDCAVQLVVEDFDLAMAWVGLVEEGTYQVRPVCSFGSGEDYLKSITVTWDESPTGQGPGGLAIRSGQAVAMNQVDTDPAFAPWSEAAQKHGFRSCASLPLRYGEQILGAFSVYSGQPENFTPDRLQVLQSFANQLALALQRARLYEQVKSYATELEQRVIDRTGELGDEKKQTQAILDTITDAVIVTDLDLNVSYVNPAWEKLTGYMLAEAVNRPPPALHTGNMPPDLMQAVQQAIFNGQPIDVAFVNQRKDGSDYDVEITIAPVKDEMGAIHRFVGVQRDVTEERQLAAMKERFIADAAHDLGNPVTVLQTSLYLLKKDPSQIQRRLPRFEHAIHQLTALVKDLLTISRLDREGSASIRQPLDLNPLVEQVVEGQRLLAAAKKQTLNLELAQGLPQVLADPNQIERVVVNLVANAINYTPENGQILVKTRRNHQTIALVVQDSGMGIVPNDLRRIFDRFYRGDGAKSSADGTGLGLAIVKEIVDQLGGKIAVDSEAGSGSTFTVSLPATKNPATGTG